MTPVGAARSLLLLLGVWWSWNDTAWFTNYFDPDRLPIHLVPVVLGRLADVRLATVSVRAKRASRRGVLWSDPRHPAHRLALNHSLSWG